MGKLAIGSLHITFEGADIKPILMTVGKRKVKVEKPPRAQPVIKVKEV